MLQVLEQAATDAESIDKSLQQATTMIKAQV
jgi:hypothetical protein